MKKFVISPYMKAQKKAATNVLDKHLRKMIPIACSLLKVPRDMKIMITPIKSRNATGKYSCSVKTVKIDSRKHTSFFGVVETLMHELVHAEQYHTKKLGYDWNQGLKTWDGVAWKKKGTTYDSYRKLPWEAEAFARSKGLAEQVFYKYQARTEISMARLDSFFQSERS